MWLTAEENEYLQNNFRKTEKSTHAVWSRRHAPMYILDDDMTSIRQKIEKCNPDYSIVFDVLFESDGKEVLWHCDYESLGPFDVTNPLTAMRDSHFKSVHFNLTPNGGCLRVLRWIVPSILLYTVITIFGIFTRMHHVTLHLLTPFLYFAKVHSNTTNYGNSFDNMQLHSVTAGNPRLSYVVRLVKHDVTVSLDSLHNAIRRSPACEVFRPLIHQTEMATKLNVQRVSYILRKHM